MTSAPTAPRLSPPVWRASRRCRRWISGAALTRSPPSLLPYLPHPAAPPSGTGKPSAFHITIAPPLALPPSAARGPRRRADAYSRGAAARARTRGLVGRGGGGEGSGRGGQGGVRTFCPTDTAHPSPRCPPRRPTSLCLPPGSDRGDQGGDGAGPAHASPAPPAVSRLPGRVRGWGVRRDAVWGGA